MTEERTASVYYRVLNLSMKGYCFVFKVLTHTATTQRTPGKLGSWEPGPVRENVVFVVLSFFRVAFFASFFPFSFLSQFLSFFLF